MCGRCGERRPLVTITSRTGRLTLCGRCLPHGLGTRNSAIGQQAASILAALLQPRQAATLTAMTPSDKLCACPKCGLTYLEFESGGRAGCASCYIAFQAAIRQALAVLHNPG